MKVKSQVLPESQKVIPIYPEPCEKPPLKNWSFSSLSEFEGCKFRSYLKRVKKVPEPDRPLPAGKMEHANDRGSRIHDSAEQYVRGLAKLTPELHYFEDEFAALQRHFQAGKVFLEEEWGMSKAWESVSWDTAWLRMKLDALYFISPSEAVVIDYKTGRRFGNELKHAEQTQLYQLTAFLRYPELETIHTELWYLDQDELYTMTFQRQQGLRFRPRWNTRGNKMTDATEFPPNANMYSCRFCLYGPKGSGVCAVGVE